MAQTDFMGVNIDPDKASSRVEVRVRFGETDLMGIVHHASYLSYFEAARVAWLRRRGASYSTWVERGWHLPVVDARVRYLAPARFEEVLAVEVSLTEVRPASVRFAYRILRGKDYLADGETRLACVDNSHELVRIPEELIQVLVRGETIQEGDGIC